MRCATVARVREHEPQTGLGELLDRARALVDTLEAWHDDRARSSRARLKDSVVRPLGNVGGRFRGPDDRR